MTNSPGKHCSWSRCDEPAAKHARFGNRTFGAHDIVSAPNQNYTTIHRNLCERHVTEVMGQYLDVTVFDLDGCSSCSR